MSKPSTSLHLPHVTKSHTSTTCNQKLSSLTPKAHCSNLTNSELRVLSLIGSKQNTASMSPFNLSTPSGTLPRPCRMAEMQYEYPISDNFYQSWRKTANKINLFSNFLPCDHKVTNHNCAVYTTKVT